MGRWQSGRQKKIIRNRLSLLRCRYLFLRSLWHVWRCVGCQNSLVFESFRHLVLSRPIHFLSLQTDTTYLFDAELAKRNYTHDGETTSREFAAQIMKHLQE